MSQQETLLTRKRDPMKVPKLILAVAVALLFLFPIVWMFFVSLKPESMPATTPFEWFLPPYTFVNYLDIIGGSDIFLWVSRAMTPRCFCKTPRTGLFLMR